MSEQLRVVCGHCKLDVQVVMDDDGNTEAVCPGCGQRDKPEDAQRIAGEHYVESVKATLNKTLQDAAKGSQLMTYKPGSPLRNDAEFRWHAVQT